MKTFTEFVSESINFSKPEIYGDDNFLVGKSNIRGYDFNVMYRSKKGLSYNGIANGKQKSGNFIIVTSSGLKKTFKNVKAMIKWLRKYNLHFSQHIEKQIEDEDYGNEPIKRGDKVAVDISGYGKKFELAYGVVWGVKKEHYNVSVKSVDDEATSDYKKKYVMTLADAKKNHPKEYKKMMGVEKQGITRGAGSPAPPIKSKKQKYGRYGVISKKPKYQSGGGAPTDDSDFY